MTPYTPAAGFLSMLIPQPLLRPHKLPNPNRNPAKQLLRPTHPKRPISLAPTPIIIHTNITPTSHRLRHPPRTRLSQPLRPRLHVVAVVVPHAVCATAHAAIIWFRGARCDSQAV